MPVCFSNEGEKEKVWIWVGRERCGRSWGRKNPNQNILY